MKIGPRLVVILLLIGLIPAVLIGVIALNRSINTLEQEAFHRLQTVRDLKKSQIEHYFQNIQNQVITLSQDVMIKDAIREFRSAFKEFRNQNRIGATELAKMKDELYQYYASDFSQEYRNQNQGADPRISSAFNMLDEESIALQYHYIKANQNPLGSKHLLDSPGDASTYSAAHVKYHPAIRGFLEKFGYYDIFLVDPDTGDIVYTVFKELDFSTSLKNGPYAQTNFGQAFREAAALSDSDQFILVDFASYKPSYEAPASFIASPVFDQGELMGVLMFQMPLDGISGIMNERGGMGDTEEIFLVGPDNKMRSDSFLDPTNRAVVASFKHPETGK
ncbi:MAG: methyl-accepting chemotaxis protein, partial [Planctomycetes bacterium]|nr:methyl-accepting chemotaxis protein [Planctomycetota bacterium]